MAVFPDKIVLKSSTDGNTEVRQSIGAGQSNEIVPGEIVVSRESSRVSLFTLDSNNSVVEIGASSDASDNSIQVRPGILLNFDGDVGDTQVDSSSVQSTYPSTTDKKFGSGSLFLGNNDVDPKDDTLRLYSSQMVDLGTYIWTLAFWIKTDPADWYVAEYPAGGPDSTWLSILGPSNYKSGPGAFHVYMDNGTPDMGGTGTSTSNSTGMALGAICLGLGPGETGTDYPDGIPSTGEVITSGGVSVADNAWHYVAIQHEGRGVYSIFIDGVLANRKTNPSSINYSDPGSSITVMPPDMEIGAPGDSTSGVAYIKPGMNGYLDAISIHVGAVLYAGVDTFEVPTSPPDDSLQGTGYNYLGALFDVHLTTPVQDQDILAFDATLNRWYNYPAPPVDISSGELGQLADVDLSTTPPNTGDGLIYDGANWVPGASTNAFADLSDISLLGSGTTLTSWGFPGGPTFASSTEARIHLQPNKFSPYVYAGLSSWGNGNISLIGGTGSSARSVLNLDPNQVRFSNSASSSSANDANFWSVVVETAPGTGNRMRYRELPNLGTGLLDLSVPCMGQVRDTGVITSTTPPSTTPNGEPLIDGSLWWNSASSILYVYEGGQWVEGSSSGGGGGDGGSSAGVTLVNSSDEVAGDYNNLEIVLPLGANLQVEDLAVVTVNTKADGNPNSPTPLAVPAGWTLASSQAYVSSSATADCYSSIIYKYISQSDIDTGTVTLQNSPALAGDDWFFQRAVFRNAVLSFSNIVDTTLTGALPVEGYDYTGIPAPIGGFHFVTATNIYAFTTTSGTKVTPSFGSNLAWLNGSSVNNDGFEENTSRRISSLLGTGNLEFNIQALNESGVAATLTDGFHIMVATIGPANPNAGSSDSGVSTRDRLTEVQTASSGAATFSGIGHSGTLLSVSSSLDAWIVLYGSNLDRNNDAGRAYNTDPAPGSGVFAEFYVTAGSTVLATPGTAYVNNDTVSTEAMYVAVRDQAGVNVDAEVTIVAYGDRQITAFSGGTFGSGV